MTEFALTLRGRGFNVVGHIDREEGRFDLATSRFVPVRPGQAEDQLRRAMREDADLVVLPGLADAEEAIGNARALVSEEEDRGIPLLTSTPRDLERGIDGRGAAIPRPDLRALWNWWGPERLYQDLALSVAEDETRRVVCGNRWILVEGPRGAGLSYLPKHPRELFPQLPALARESLRSLAAMALSWNPVEAALGLAAINAHHNRVDLDALPGNGARSMRAVAGRMVAVGAFPGIDDILPGAAVIETAPRPGEYPPRAMETLLPDCAGAVVNSSTLVGRTLPHILRLVRGRPLALIGPATPMTPRLFDHGVSLMGGLVVHDPDGLATAVRAGASPREFGRFGRFVHITE